MNKVKSSCIAGPPLSNGGVAKVLLNIIWNCDEMINKIWSKFLEGLIVICHCDCTKWK